MQQKESLGHSPFFETNKKILRWFLGNDNRLNIFGLDANNYLLATSYLFQSPSLESSIANSHVFVFSDSLSCENSYFVLKEFFDQHGLHPILFKSSELTLYKSDFTSGDIINDQFDCLSNLAFNSQQNFVLFTHVSALGIITPPLDFFKERILTISKDEILTPGELSAKLAQIGYEFQLPIFEKGTFCTKGEIIDIYPIGGPPIRITYFDDLIEHIYEIDPQTNKTISSREYNSVRIGPSAKCVLLSDQLVSNIKKKLPSANPKFPKKQEEKISLNKSLSEKKWSDKMLKLIPLAFDDPKSLGEIIPSEKCIWHFFSPDEFAATLNQVELDLKEEHEKKYNNIDSSFILPPPEFYFKNNHDLLTSNKRNIYISENPCIENETSPSIVSCKVVQITAYATMHEIKLEKKNKIKFIFELISRHLQSGGNVFFVAQSSRVTKEVNHLIDIHLEKCFLEKIHFINFSIESGFYLQESHSLCISEVDLFGLRKSVTKKISAKKMDFFAEQISTLIPGDYLIHAVHGIGKFVNISTLENLGQKNDFVLIEYADKDKVYVPVYKLNLIQKHAESGQNIKLSSLKNSKFIQAKNSAKESAKKLAIDLLRLQAERASLKAHAFSPPDNIYLEFELSFPYVETTDQQRAINEVLEDMQKDGPMDRLVCGDVGFGKTEVAMRAAFKAVQDGKQVAILVPTTILALQHYYTFSKRFAQFPVNICYLSRFKKASEIKSTVEQINTGKQDIIIGTHKILSDKIKFHDLGLVIIDEEQRFGVNHKEKLKVLRQSVDFLTLTATPIPRTLNMALIGLKNLSVIQTPPPTRQSIETIILKNDFDAIISAIEKELSRGGQVFYVHNKIFDLDSHVLKLKEALPNAKIVVVHGQLSEADIESRMLSFYNGEADILVSTTIIESGLDIPNANTLIVDRADTFGLSQLHQLRGRIGRSEKKAFAYLSIPQTEQLSEIALKRMKAIQGHSQLGAGFLLASADLDIRGSGNILGAEQSGHIEGIGLELYLELLREAIAELKNEKFFKKSEVEMQLPFPSCIPDNFIPDPSSRLKFYKKLANSSDDGSLFSTLEEIENNYGSFPPELENLTKILQIRNLLQKIGVILVRLTKNILTLKFDEKFLTSNFNQRERLIQFFSSRPKVYQFSPDFSVSYKKQGGP